LVFLQSKSNRNITFSVLVFLLLFLSLHSRNSTMFKFLLSLGIIAYVFYKIGGLFFRAGAASQQSRTQYRKPENNNPAAAKKDKRNGTIKGGDYIDYEEVK
jgi:hypothetical protein